MSSLPWIPSPPLPTIPVEHPSALIMVLGCRERRSLVMGIYTQPIKKGGTRGAMFCVGQRTLVGVIAPFTCIERMKVHLGNLERQRSQKRQVFEAQVVFDEAALIVQEFKKRHNSQQRGDDDACRLDIQFVVASMDIDYIYLRAMDECGEEWNGACRLDKTDGGMPFFYQARPPGPTRVYAAVVGFGSMSLKFTLAKYMSEHPRMNEEEAKRLMEKCMCMTYPQKGAYDRAIFALVQQWRISFARADLKREWFNCL